MQKLKYNGNFILETCYKNLNTPEVSSSKTTKMANPQDRMSSKPAKDSGEISSSEMSQVLSSPNSEFYVDTEMCTIGDSFSIAPPINLKGAVTVFDSLNYMNISLTRNFLPKYPKNSIVSESSLIQATRSLPYEVSFYMRTPNSSGLVFSFVDQMRDINLNDETAEETTPEKTAPEKTTPGTQNPGIPNFANNSNFKEVSMLAAEVYDGYLSLIWRYHLDLEFQVLSFYNFRINDTNWHRIVIRRDINHVHFLTVDNLTVERENMITGSVDPAGDNRKINSFINRNLVRPVNPFFVGGINANYLKNIVGVESFAGFTGCIGNFKINRNYVNLQDFVKFGDNGKAAVKECKSK